MAANGYENAAGLQITAPVVVCQAPVAQVIATGSQGGAEDQASSWSVISGTNTCDISADGLLDNPIASDNSAAETILKRVLAVIFTFRKKLN
jgi:hypothetical protein